MIKTRDLPYCPSCGRLSVMTETQWGARHDCYDCKLHSWNGQPLVDQETHDARQDAHNAFDPLWHFGRMTRGEAYRLLAVEMEMKPRDCHISRMSKAQALAVRGHVTNIFSKLKGEANAQERRNYDPGPAVGNLYLSQFGGRRGGGF